MALEDLTGPDKFITDLVAANPDGDDGKNQGDDHIRGVKNVLGNTFPSLDGAVDYDATTLVAAIEAALAGTPQIGDFKFTSLPAAYDGVNWMPPDGRAISRTTYATAFARWGTTYGAGDGSTTFNIPTVTEGEALEMTLLDAQLGEQRGADDVELTEPHMPQQTVPYTRTDYQGQRAEARADGYFVYNDHNTINVTIGNANPTPVPVVGPRRAWRVLVRVL